MKGVVMFRVSAVIFNAKRFTDDASLLFIAIDSALLLDDVGWRCGGTTAVRKVVVFCVWWHDDHLKSLSKSLLGSCSLLY